METSIASVPSDPATEWLYGGSIPPPPATEKVNTSRGETGMELFQRERQHEPLVMLGDLIKLYALTYGVDGSTAVAMICTDAKGIAKVGESMAKASA